MAPTAPVPISVPPLLTVIVPPSVPLTARMPASMVAAPESALLPVSTSVPAPVLSIVTPALEVPSSLPIAGAKVSV